MESSLRRLTDAVAILSDEARVLELAVAALHEACGRGSAFGATSRGEHANRLGLLRAMKNGALVEIDMTHLAYTRTPAIDIANVPREQRNRWVEPFREGIATHEGFKASTLYPLVKHLEILEQGRVIVCCGARQVAVAGAGVPEGTTFTDAERARLVETSSALVVPLRMAALLDATTAERSPLDVMLDASEEAVVAVNSDGEIVDTSRSAFALVRSDRSIPDRIRASVRALERSMAVVTSDDYVIHLSRCAADRAVAYLAVIDGKEFAEAPIALTDRQWELIEHLERGLTNAQIGDAMSVAASTVKTMLERLYERVSVANRVELLSWAHKNRSNGPA